MTAIYRRICAVLVLLMLAFGWTSGAYAQNPKTYIHPRAAALKPLVLKETQQHFPAIPQVHYTFGLIEHESCLSLKHSRCWQPTSELKTQREQGLGLGQLTRAYDKQGRLRFDTLAEMRRQQPKALSELSWDTLAKRPDLQIRTIVIMTRQNYNALSGVKDPVERLKMADSAYNGGISNVHKSRSVCALAKNCDPGIWFEHTERYNQKSTKKLYDVRSPRDINNHHVRDVFLLRMPKFQQYLEGPAL